jgi:hypothetical protein
MIGTESDIILNLGYIYIKVAFYNDLWYPEWVQLDEEQKNVRENKILYQ